MSNRSSATSGHDPDQSLSDPATDSSARRRSASMSAPDPGGSQTYTATSGHPARAAASYAQPIVAVCRPDAAATTGPRKAFGPRDTSSGQRLWWATYAAVV